MLSVSIDLVSVYFLQNFFLKEIDYDYRFYCEELFINER